MTSLRELAEREADQTENELQTLALKLFFRRAVIAEALEEVWHLSDPDWTPSAELVEEARVELNRAPQKEGGGTDWAEVGARHPHLAHTIAFIRTHGWGVAQRGETSPTTHEEPPMAKGKGTKVELTEAEMAELREAVTLREKDLENARNYLGGKGLSVTDVEERQKVLKGDGAHRPGLKAKLGFRDQDDPDQLDIEDAAAQSDE